MSGEDRFETIYNNITCSTTEATNWIFRKSVINEYCFNLSRTAALPWPCNNLFADPRFFLLTF